jgi:transposase
MTVTPHGAEDQQSLGELVRRENNARQRDRYRAVLLAMCGLEGDEIAGRLGRSPRFVDEWVGRYRRGGLGALRPRKQPGRRPKLTSRQEEQLKKRLAGPGGPSQSPACGPGP